MVLKSLTIKHFPFTNPKPTVHELPPAFTQKITGTELSCVVQPPVAFLRFRLKRSANPTLTLKPLSDLLSPSSFYFERSQRRGQSIPSNDSSSQYIGWIFLAPFLGCSIDLPLHSFPSSLPRTGAIYSFCLRSHFVLCFLQFSFHLSLFLFQSQIESSLFNFHSFLSSPVEGLFCYAFRSWHRVALGTYPRKLI
jgi:hypothetical protein